nr:hypothetical protein [Tanacetum cinerariifolium]
MIPEPGDANREINVTETFHLQTDDELSDKELKQIEADDHAIQTILLCLPEDIYAAVDSCETTQEIWLQSKLIGPSDGNDKVIMWYQEPRKGDANREFNVTETFHLQTDDELSDKELKQIEDVDQAI